MRIATAVDTLPSNVASLRNDAAASGQAAPEAGVRRDLDTAVLASQAARDSAGKRDSQADAERVKAAVESVNRSLSSRSAQVQFAFDSDSGRVLVKLIDVETSKVLRQVPNEEMLRIAKNIDRMRGIGIEHAA